MPDQFPLPHPRCEDGTGSDVVNKCIGSHHDPNVPETLSIQIPSHQITGEEILIVAPFDFSAATLEIRLQIRNPTMVDIFVGTTQSPELRVSRKRGRHVLMHERLEIDPDRAVGPNHHIRADAGVSGNIATGVFQRNIGGIIPDRLCRFRFPRLHGLA